VPQKGAGLGKRPSSGPSDGRDARKKVFTSLLPSIAELFKIGYGVEGGLFVCHSSLCLRVGGGRGDLSGFDRSHPSRFDGLARTHIHVVLFAVAMNIDR
jgi:hypothetical protein